MKKTVEEKAEMAKQKIDNKLQKQKQKQEKAALKKEKAANKKAAKKEAKQQKKAAKQQKKAAKQEISSGKKDLKAQQKSAKKEAAKMKKQQKQEAKNKMKELKAKAKQPKETSSPEPSQEKETPSKKTKASKKEAKAKKPKKGKKGKDDVVEKGGSKKILFIALLALVFAGSGIAGFLHFRGGEKEENPDPYIEAYVLDDDFVTSIPKFLEQSETRALPEITVEDDTNSKKVIYDYTGLKGAAKEVKDYINYLTEENEFVPMFDFNLDAPAGYISIGTASAEEGKILKLDIDYTDSDYKVMMSKTTETLPKPKTNDSAKGSGTRDGALNYLTSIASDTLGLEKPVEEYKAIYDPGQSSINEGSFYGINLYEPNQIGTNEFIGKFFVETNQSSIFRYNSAENSYTEVVNKKASTKKKESMEIAETTAEDIANNTENIENTEETEETQKEDKKNEHQKGQKPEREETEDKKTKSKGR